MPIEKLGTNYKLWNSYVSDHSHGTVYHTTEWMRAIEKTFDINNHYYYLSENGKLKGILPLFYVDTLFSGKKAVSVPYAVYGGVLANDDASEKILIDYARELVKNNNITFLELRNLYPANVDFKTQDIYVTFIKKIETSDEEILAAIPRKSRASIRNGYKKFDLKPVLVNDVDKLYNLYLVNKRNLGSPPYPKSFFKNLLNEFKDSSGILFIEYEKKLVAGVIFFKFKDTIYPYFSGADKRFNFTNANNILYYELMKYALHNNIEYFDFGRSRVGTGAGAFKKNMGFEDQKLNYYYYNIKDKDLPNISPSNSKFNIMTSLWTKLPLAVTRAIGPFIVKRVP